MNQEPVSRQAAGMLSGQHWMRTGKRVLRAAGTLGRWREVGVGLGGGGGVVGGVNKS